MNVRLHAAKALVKRIEQGTLVIVIVVRVCVWEGDRLGRIKRPLAANKQEGDAEDAAKQAGYETVDGLHGQHVSQGPSGIP